MRLYRNSSGGVVLENKSQIVLFEYLLRHRVIVDQLLTCSVFLVNEMFADLRCVDRNVCFRDLERGTRLVILVLIVLQYSHRVQMYLVVGYTSYYSAINLSSPHT